MSDLFELLDPSVASYVALALIVWWLTRATYSDADASKGELIDRYGDRLTDVESTVKKLARRLQQKNAELTEALADLASARAELASARAAEERCIERMEALEERYEKRIAELEAEIDELRRRLEEQGAA